MNKESVIVYSGKSLSTIRKEGGLGDWTANPERVKSCEYLVLCRNRREHLSEKDQPQGTAILIAKVVDVQPSIHAGRCKIVFNDYAALEVPDAWRLLTNGQRFPVGYLSSEQLLQRLQVDPAALSWIALNEPPQSPIILQPPIQLSGFAATLAQAKQSLADELGIPVTNIDIKITV